MPRNIWMAFQVNEKEFARAEKLVSENASEIPENHKNTEWKILKEIQRDERAAFFAQGKEEFSALRNSIYREVREEFREQWADFYVMQKNGVDAEFLATAKAQLVADQKSVLEPRRDEACQELRESRDIRYRELLDDQKEMRAELRWRRDAGLDATPFLNEMEERRQAGQEIRTEFRETGRELLDVNRWPISKPVGRKRPKTMMRPLWDLTSTFISAAGSATPSWRLPTPYFVIWLISVPHRRNRCQMRRGRTCSVRRLRTPLSSISGTSVRRKTPVHASDSGLSANDSGTGPATSASPAHTAYEMDGPLDEGDAAEIEIETISQRKIAGARLLPRRGRALGRRGAREWRRLALKALCERRLSERHARRTLRQLKHLRSPGFDWRWRCLLRYSAVYVTRTSVASKPLPPAFCWANEIELNEKTS
jgi:hypothetical protein